MATIAAPQPGDVEHIRRLSKSVFSEFGPYASLLPRFFATQGVTTYMAREGKEVLGFVLLGFLPWADSDGAKGEPWIADILAIAVKPTHQHRGVGRLLMRQAFVLTQEMADWREIREIQLTCAENNQIGLAFFKSLGFQVIDRNHGHYANGQKALRLSRAYP